MAQNILQSEVLTQFLYPFLLIFFIVFALLEKTKIFGTDKKQVNALIAFVVGIMFVAAVDTQLLVGNMVVFLAVGVVLVFVVLLLWGFVTGEEAKFTGKGVKPIVGVIVILALVIFLFIVTGISNDVYDWFFKSSWSSDVWTNIIFVVIIAAALAVVLVSGKKKD